MNKKNTNAFTMMELLIVIFLISIITAIAIPIYDGFILKSRERDAIVQLTGLYGANQMYKARTGGFWDPGGPQGDLDVINQNLGIRIIPNGMSYLYSPDAGSPATLFSATASWVVAGQAFTIQIDERPVTSEIGIENPCCENFPDCPSLPGC